MSTPELEQVSPETLAIFHAQRTALVRAVVTRSMERHHEVAQHGEAAEHLLTVGLDFTTQALEVAMRLHSLAMLDYQLQWSNERLPHDGVLPEHLLTRFELLAQVVETMLPAQHARSINQFVQWMIARQRELMQTKNT